MRVADEGRTRPIRDEAGRTLRGLAPLLEGVARVLSVAGLAVGLGVPGTSPLEAQDLADYDYENLGFRGVSFEGGYLWATRIDPTPTYGVRMDMGYLGPGLRIVSGLTYWSSELKEQEVSRFESQLAELIRRETNPGGVLPIVDLGAIKWSDIVLSMDGHMVWRVPFGILTTLGLGGSAHILNGEGAAIDQTFVEDLLDSVVAGVNVHGGFELVRGERWRLYSTMRYEILADLRYWNLRGGIQIMTGSSAPGEVTAPGGGG